MRLRTVEHRHRLAQRLKLILIALVSRRRVPDVVKTLLYRPEFFGRPMCAWTQADVRPADVEPLRAAGVSDEGVEDAIQVCVLFNLYDRLADSLSFHLPGPDGYAASGRSLLRRGYQL